MDDWKDWSRWLQEGYFISYVREGIRYYEYVIYRDLAHWEYNWPEAIATLSSSGPYVPEDLEITRGYDLSNNLNNIWQMIFGIEGQAYIYIELPTDLHRHGIPKQPKPGTANREVSHFEEWMSPFIEPSFITEHFLMRPDIIQIGLDAYNPLTTAIRPRLNFFIAKLITERVGTEESGELATPDFGESDVAKRKTAKIKAKWEETLTKLYKRQIPHRPLTLMPVRMPAEAPGGE